MKIKLITLFTILTITKTFSQVTSNQTNNNIWVAKEFSKDIALYNSKNFCLKMF